MYRITLGLYLYLAVFADAYYRSCDSQIGSLNNITVSNCYPNVPKCTLNRGKNVTFELNFNLDKDIKRVSPLVRGVIFGVTLPHPNTLLVFHEESELKSPLTKDDGPYSYKLNLLVHQKFPQGNVDIKVELMDEDNMTIVCMLIPYRIKYTQKKN